jgi:hypothetical protein
VGRLRPGEQEALGVRALQGLQHAALGGVLDGLGHDVEPQAARQLDDRGDQRWEAPSCARSVTKLRSILMVSAGSRRR